MGRRPAVVVQAGARYEALPTLIVVPLTSQREALRFPGTFLIPRGAGNGLSEDSVALVFQVRAVDRARVGMVLGRLSPTDLATLERELRAVQGLASP